MSKETMKLALEALEAIAAYRPMTFAECSDAEAIMGIAENAIPALREALAEPDFWEGYVPEPVKPAQPVAFPTRRAVEREIERISNPTGMHLNDAKERVALPGGTLRHMLALIDRTSPPAQPDFWEGYVPEPVGVVGSSIKSESPLGCNGPTGPAQQEPVACPYCHNSHTLGAVYFDQNCVGCVKRMTTPPQRKPPQFPTMLRKMWSGAEVQKWINENWSKT